MRQAARDCDGESRRCAGAVTATLPYLWQDALLLLALGIALGAGGGVWLGFKLWRQTYVRHSAHPISNARWRRITGD